jgi:imidazolonepropionase-like amidohydrolase
MGFSGPLLMTGSGGGGRAAGPAPLNLDDEAFWGIGDEDTARQQVRRLAAYHPDLVKIVFMTRDAQDLAAKTRVIRAAIVASHAEKLRVAVHATTLETASAAVDAGADILVHSVADRDIDDAFVKAVVSRKVMVSPTLLVGQMYREALSGKVTLEPFERKCAPANTVQSFDALPALNIRRERPDAMDVQKRNLKRLYDAGAIIFVGSDAGNTRTLHGPSLHRELALMAEAGLPPMSLLVAATHTNARMMGREKELGQIAPGMLADVLLLDADPLVDIRNTRRTYKVIRGGSFYEPSGR